MYLRTGVSTGGRKQAVGEKGILALTLATFRTSSRNHKIAKSPPVGQGVHDVTVKLPCFW